MKLIQNIHSDAIGFNSRWHDKKWLECESIDEFESELAKYKNIREQQERSFLSAKERNGSLPCWRYEGQDWFDAFVYNNWSLKDNVEIIEKPRLRCSDGWHYYEGNFIKGEGFIWHEVFERSERTLYIMKPGAIVQKGSKEEWMG